MPDAAPPASADCDCVRLCDCVKRQHYDETLAELATLRAELAQARSWAENNHKAYEVEADEAQKARHEQRRAEAERDEQRSLAEHWWKASLSQTNRVTELLELPERLAEQIAALRKAAEAVLSPDYVMRFVADPRNRDGSCCMADAAALWQLHQARLAADAPVTTDTHRELPSTRSLTRSDPDFTGTLSTEEFIRGIRGTYPDAPATEVPEACPHHYYPPDGESCPFAHAEPDT